MEKVKHSFKVFDNILEITPEDGIQDNSVYEIRIKKIKSEDGVASVENLKLKIYTKLTPSYCSLEAVKSIIDGFDFEDSNILYCIREASRLVEYATGYTFNEDIPFEVSQYVKYKAAYDSLLRGYISKSSSEGEKGTLGEISYENSSGKSLKDLLKLLKDEADKWEDHMRGHGFDKARPQGAIRGKYADPYLSSSIYGFGRGVVRCNEVIQRQYKKDYR